MPSATTIAYDTLSDVTDTNLDVHTPDSGWGGWEYPPPSNNYIHETAAVSSNNGGGQTRGTSDLSDDDFRMYIDVFRGAVDNIGQNAGLVFWQPDSLSSASLVLQPGVHVDFLRVDAWPMSIVVSHLDDDGSTLMSSTVTADAGPALNAGMRLGVDFNYPFLSIWTDVLRGDDPPASVSTFASISVTTDRRDGNYKRMGFTASATGSSRMFLANAVVGVIPSILTIPESASTLSTVVVSTSQTSSQWSSVQSATGYKLQRQGTSDATLSTVSSIQTSTVLSYVDTGLTSFSSYTYGVVSYNSQGDGPRSNLVAIRTAEAFSNSPPNNPNPTAPAPSDPWTPTAPGGAPEGGPGSPGSGGGGTAGAGTVVGATGGPWARAYPQDIEDDGGVDYELRTREDFPFSASEDLPHAVSSSISEGKP